MITPAYKTVPPDLKTTGGSPHEKNEKDAQTCSFRIENKDSGMEGILWMWVMWEKSVIDSVAITPLNYSGFLC